MARSRSVSQPSEQRVTRAGGRAASNAGLVTRSGRVIPAAPRQSSRRSRAPVLAPARIQPQVNVAPTETIIQLEKRLRQLRNQHIPRRRGFVEEVSLNLSSHAPFKGGVMSSSRKRKAYGVRPERAIRNITGRGGYREVMSAVGKAIKRMTPEGAFSRIGTAGGGAMGGPTGAMIGGLLGKGIAQLAGFGAYNVNANSLVASIDEGVQIPQFANASHATVVRHREFIQDIKVPATPTAFTNVSFPINPGMTGVFPWLSGVAENYDQYQILGMIFEFRSLSGDTTNGGALGSIVMATDYDAADDPYGTKIIMENSEYATSNKPHIDTVHVVECDPGLTHSPIKFVRHGVVPGSKDIRLYDHGTFQLATVGLPGSANEILGELWVSYEIAFYKPSILENSMQVDHFSLPTSVATTNYLSLDTTTINQAQVGSTLGGTTKGSTYYFPPAVSSGVYKLFYQVFGQTGALATGFTFTYANCNSTANPTLLFNEAGTDYASSQNNTGLSNAVNWVAVIVQVTAGDATVTISTGSLPATPSGGDLFVTRLPSTMIGV